MDSDKSIFCRPAKLEELTTLKAFEQGIILAERPFDPTLKPDPISYYDIGALIESADAEVIVAVSGDELVGSGYVKILESKDYKTHERHGYIGFMFVKPEYRGRGVCQALVDELMGWSKSQGLKEVKLEVYDENDAAVRAYAKAGFTKNLVEMRRAL